MATWAACESSQKSGAADVRSSEASFCSLLAKSKTHHNVRDPVAQIFKRGLQFLHRSFLFVFSGGHGPIQATNASGSLSLGFT